MKLFLEWCSLQRALPPAQRRLQPWLLVVAAALGLVACGGGGGGGSEPPAPVIAPNQPPTAAARLSGEALVNVPTLFDTSGTGDADGSIVSRGWTYGDGQSGSIDNHVYISAGAYTATYTVTDNSGATVSTTVAVTVLAPNRPPTAAATWTGPAVAQVATSFDTTASTDTDGTIAARSWAYGDGQTGTADSHVYASAGTYTATYSVTDDRGASASKAVTVTVVKCSAAGTRAATLSPFTSVCVQTSLGEMVFEVFPNWPGAEHTVANFLRYVDDGFYTGTLFHRVVPDFVIQGGGYLPGVTVKPATYAPIALQSNNRLQNKQYTLAMARTDVADSATSQFFVNLVDNPALDYNPAVGAPNGYAVFGQVISGQGVLATIAAVPTGTRAGLANLPLRDVVIQGMVRLP